MSNEYEADIFISHASEDKYSFVDALATHLSDMGLIVWYDKFSLRIGDSLSESIGNGLSEARYGVVVISASFISKKWPKRELAMLTVREDYSDKVILPIWHGVSKRQVLEGVPLLADKVAATSDEGVHAVAQKIFDIVGVDRIANRKFKRAVAYEEANNPKAAFELYVEVVKIDRNHILANERLYAIDCEDLLPSGRYPLIFGRIKWFNYGKGFGFIAAEDGSDCFFHIASVECSGTRNFSEGDKVVFACRSIGDKQAAVSIRKLT